MYLYRHANKAHCCCCCLPLQGFPLVNFKGTVEQTFIFLDTPDLRSYKKTYGKAAVQKKDLLAERIVITDNAWKMCQT